MKLPKEWKEFIEKMNIKGVPIPVVRDPKTGVGSVSLTLVFLSSLWVQIGLIGKLSGFLGGFDIDAALYWFMACSALYWGRKLSGNKSDTKLGDE